MCFAYQYYTQVVPTTRRIFSALLPATVALLSAACASTAPPEAAEAVTIDAPASALEGERYLEVRVGAHIDAPPAAVWAVLSDATAYPEWNSTVLGLEGAIAEGEVIELTSIVDPDRTFELTVSAVVPNEGMVWSDGNRRFRGERTFTLRARADGTTEFTMREVFTGSMMGMIAPSLPDFRPSFDAFASDLVVAAEAQVQAAGS